GRQRLLPGQRAPGAAADRAQERGLRDRRLPRGEPRLRPAHELARRVPADLQAVRAHLEVESEAPIPAAQCKISGIVMSGDPHRLLSPGSAFMVDGDDTRISDETLIGRT